MDTSNTALLANIKLRAPKRPAQRRMSCNLATLGQFDVDCAEVWALVNAWQALLGDDWAVCANVDPFTDYITSIEAQRVREFDDEFAQAA